MRCASCARGVVSSSVSALCRFSVVVCVVRIVYVVRVVFGVRVVVSCVACGACVVL